MKKRIFSIILSICMVIMFVPISTKAMKIYVDLSITGEATLTLEVESGDRIDNVKEKIKNETGYPKAQQTLKYGDRVLENDSTLADYNIQRDSTIELSLEVPEGLVYTISEGTVTIIDYNGSATEIAIPGTIDSKPVKTIGDRAFQDCYHLERVIIPDGVTSIGSLAFNSCHCLKSINIPASVTSIGGSAFWMCFNLEHINIPEGVLSIGNSAFNSCTSLKSITIPSSVTSIENGVFASCNSLESITIPSSVSSIGDVVFLRCTSLKSITIPSNVTSIGDNVFEGCSGLESITIPSNVTSIGNYTFEGCNGLESILLPDGLDASGASIPNEVTKVRYSLDQTTGEVKITKIDLGTGKTSVDIPDTICGDPVVAVAAGENTKVGAHTCKGGTATCTAKALCILCGKEYGTQTNHNLESIPAKAATVTETGNKEYWHCKDCGKYFLDKNGKNNIELADTVTQKLTPEIIEGMEQSQNAGEAKELIFRSNAAFGDFIRVELDGKTLDAANYTVKEGSTIVTLKADYVGTLSTGKHTIGIVSTSGTATTTFKINAKADNDTKSPKTGDSSQLALWIVLLFASGSLLIVTGVCSKREKNSARSHK